MSISQAESPLAKRMSWCQPAAVYTALIEAGAPGPIRTDDLRFRKPTLYPLSYGGGCLLAALLCGTPSLYALGNTRLDRQC